MSAILAADVAGYSRLMHHDEEGTHVKLAALLKDIVNPAIGEHGGRIVKNTGDGLLAEFPSAVEAVRAAIQFQTHIKELTIGDAEDDRIAFRVGVNVGDVIAEPHDIFGDDVNIAARLESIAEPGGVCISQAVLNHARDKISFDVKDAGEQTLKNIARPVHVYRIIVDPGRSPMMPKREATALALPDKPSIAVLPFQNMSGDPEQEYFADGMVEEIITALSRVRQLFVIARNSSFTYKGRAVDIKQVGRELGVRYVLEGSVRKAGNRVRITGQLIDAATGAHLWAEHFDGALDDIFELQDQVASNVVGAIEPKLLLAETERAIRKPTESLGAYDLYLRALAQFHKFTQPGRDVAIALLSQALALDPSYAPAAAAIGWCRLFQAFTGSPVSTSEIAESVRLATQVIETGRDQPDALWMAAYTLSVFTGAHATAAEMIDQALTVNPNSANAWCIRGWVSAMQDQPDRAIEALQRAMRLSPLDPQHWAFVGGMSFAHLVARSFEEAIGWADRYTHQQPRLGSGYRIKAVACASRPRSRGAGMRTTHPRVAACIHDL